MFCVSCGILVHDFTCEFGDVRLKVGKWLPRRRLEGVPSSIDASVVKGRRKRPYLGLSLGPIPIGQGMFLPRHVEL
ncbi:hypothetical protein N9Z64_00250 [bacterium]|nr:hypothetical protein [bacterium]